MYHIRSVVNGKESNVRRLTNWGTRRVTRRLTRGMELPLDWDDQIRSLKKGSSEQVGYKRHEDEILVVTTRLRRSGDSRQITYTLYTSE